VCTRVIFNAILGPGFVLCLRMCPFLAVCADRVYYCMIEVHVCMFGGPGLYIGCSVWLYQYLGPACVRGEGESKR